jgi:cullin 4
MKRSSKKLVVNLRAAGRAETSEVTILDQKWTTLRSFLLSLFSNDTGSRIDNHIDLSNNTINTSLFSYEEIFGAVADVCALPHLCTPLFSKVRGEFYERAEQLVARIERVAHGSGDDAALLRSVEAAWATHCAESTLLRAVFTPLDRAAMSSSSSSAANGGINGSIAIKPIRETGIDAMRAAMERTGSLIPRIVRALVSQIRRERLKETIERPVMQAVVRLFVALGLYNRDAEPAIVRDANDFYQAEGLQRIAEVSNGDPSQYIRHVETSITDEIARVGVYLVSSTLRPLLRAIDTHLLSAHLTSVVDQGLAPLILQNRREDLQKLYKLSIRVGRNAEVRAAFGQYCTEKARIIVGIKDDAEKDKVLVAALLAFRDELEKIVGASFDESFISTLKSSIETAVNARENRPAELIARYVDGRLRSGSKGVGSEDTLETELDKVMQLFKCIQGKDVFEAFYKKDLAKRLLLDRTSSMDLERSMVNRLRVECGSQFTSKLEGMFRDVELARELNSKFATSKFATGNSSSSSPTGTVTEGAGGGGGGGGLEKNTHVTVITTANWPSYPATPIILPPELSRASKSFDAFYGQLYSQNRVLSWQHSLGRCTIKARFPKGMKELEVSTVQAVVLMIFNEESKGLTFLQVKDQTGIEAAELRRTLQSLSLGQYRVLRKERPGKEVEDSDVFHFNENFETGLVRIKINQIQVKESEQEIDATNDKVLQDRQYQIDAAIVRIMKSRKNIPRQVLFSELAQQLRFAVTSEMINKRLVSLIDRDYLEIDEADSSRLTYLA